MSRRRLQAGHSVGPFLSDVESLLTIGLPEAKAFSLALKSHAPLEKLLGDEPDPDASLVTLLADAGQRAQLPALAQAARTVELATRSGQTPAEALRAASAGFAPLGAPQA